MYRVSWMVGYLSVVISTGKGSHFPRRPSRIELVTEPKLAETEQSASSRKPDIINKGIWKCIGKCTKQDEAKLKLGYLLTKNP